MNYAYVRVSSTSQNIDRQIKEVKAYGIEDQNIFIDFQSGKDFERKSYQTLKSILKEGDLIIIKSIDRLGRNYDMILEEWRCLTKEIKADIFVIDMPLLDTREKENLIGKFIADIVLQILSFFAEKEREFIRQRQMEGIRIAKEKGIAFGRPKIELTENDLEVFKMYFNNEIKAQEAMNYLSMTRSTFYRKVKEIMEKYNVQLFSH